MFYTKDFLQNLSKRHFQRISDEKSSVLFCWKKILEYPRLFGESLTEFR